MARGQKLFAALKIPASWRVELYLQREVHRDIGRAERHPKDSCSGGKTGVGVRVLRLGRQGFASANAVSPAIVRDLARRAVISAAVIPPEKHRVFFSPASHAPGVVSPGGRFCDKDRDLFTRDVKELQATLAALERRALSGDRRIKKVLAMAVRETEGSVAVVNSEGVGVENSYGAVSFSVELLGQAKDDVQVAWDYAEKRFWKDVLFDETVDVARERLLRSFGGKPISSGVWPVVFSPHVGVEFLEPVSDAFCADAVQHGRSFLGGCRGKKAGSSRLTLIDDGRYPRGLASAVFDDEGCPTQTTVLMQDGAVREFLYDHHTACKEKRQSTGNASRSGFDDSPSPSSSNFYMKPGDLTVKDLVAGTKRAFWVENVLGMHTADTVTGEFSVGASGVLIEKGRPVRAVKGVTLAGNFKDLLKNVDAVADDLTWYGDTGSPTFRVSGLSVSGS